MSAEARPAWVAYVLCGACDGEGMVPDRGRYDSETGAPEWIECTVCDGAGEVPDEEEEG